MTDTRSSILTFLQSIIRDSAALHEVIKAQLEQLNANNTALKESSPIAAKKARTTSSYVGHFVRNTPVSISAQRLAALHPKEEVDTPVAVY